MTFLMIFKMTFYLESGRTETRTGAITVPIQLRTARGKVLKMGPIHTMIISIKVAETIEAKCVTPPADSWSELGAEI